MYGRVTERNVAWKGQKTRVIWFDGSYFVYLCIWPKALKTYNNIADMNKEELMRRAIALSEESVLSGGGPFGAVIARSGTVVAEASNSVTLDSDPTAHAEVNAIRAACNRLHTFDLSGCEIYCSCEPCPMCLGAIYWARIDHIYYANDRKAAAGIGFDDDLIYQEIGRGMSHRHKPIEELLPEEGRRAFELWRDKTDKTQY